VAEQKPKVGSLRKIFDCARGDRFSDKAGRLHGKQANETRQKENLSLAYWRLKLNKKATAKRNGKTNRIESVLLTFPKSITQFNGVKNESRLRITQSRVLSIEPNHRQQECKAKTYSRHCASVENHMVQRRSERNLPKTHSCRAVFNVAMGRY
jgi:hypothetical protein